MKPKPDDMCATCGCQFWRHSTAKPYRCVFHDMGNPKGECLAFEPKDSDK